jgi:O-antigen ligase
MEIGIIRELISYRRNGAIIPASIFVMLSVTMVLTITTVLYRRKRVNKHINKIIYVRLALDLLILLRGVYAENVLVFFAQFLWFAVPFYYAYSVIKFIDYFDLRASNVGKVGLFYFVVYVGINIIINIRQFGFFISGDLAQSRLVSPGGGPVVLGYTIALAVCYLLNIKGELPKTRSFFFMSILSLGAILTGSRGAIWPLMLLIVLYLMTGKRVQVQILVMLIFLIVVIAFNPVSIIASLVPRIMDVSGGSRAITVANAISGFSEQPFFDKLLGVGLGARFPYQSWLSGGNSMPSLLSFNTFSFNGQALLVQPHNSYIYLLLETGVVGLFLFLMIFFVILKAIGKSHISTKKYRYVFILLVLSLNYLDSIFIIQPASAGLWWILTFFVVTAEYA